MTSTTTKPPESVHEVGHRFCPTDLELMNYFLRHKILGNDHLVRRIPQVEFYEFEPWNLPYVLGENSNNQESFFFCRRRNKYPNSERTNRTTKAGHWKSTGRDRKIKNEVHKVIGTKKTLVYKPCSPNITGINWIIHEYSATLNLVNERDYALCKVMKKPYKKAKMTEKKAQMPNSDEGESGFSTAFDNGKQYPTEKTNCSTNNEGESSCNIVSYTDNIQSDEIIEDSACDKSEADYFCIPNQKSDKSTYDEGEPSHCMPAASEKHAADVTIPEKAYSEMLPLPTNYVTDSTSQEEAYSEMLPLPTNYVTDSTSQEEAYSEMLPLPTNYVTDSTTQEKAYSEMLPLSTNYVTDSTTQEEAYPEMLPLPTNYMTDSTTQEELDPEQLSYVGPFSPFNELDYSLNNVLGSNMPPTQAFSYNGACTSSPFLEEDTFDGLEPLTSWVSTLTYTVA